MMTMMLPGQRLPWRRVGRSTKQDGHGRQPEAVGGSYMQVIHKNTQISDKKAF